MLGLVGILARIIDRLETEIIAQHAHISSRVFRHRQYVYVWCELPNRGPFHRIVISKDQTVEANIQRLGDMLDVLGLVRPVRDEHGEIVQLQHHLGMFLERLACIGIIVLGADRQDDPALLQALHRHLKCQEGFAFRIALANFDPGQPVFPDNAAPARIVQIQHQAFLRQPEFSRDQCRHMTRQQGQGFEADALLGEMPVAVIEPGALAELGRQSLDIHQRHAAQLIRLHGQCIIHRMNDRPAAFRYARGKVPEGFVQRRRNIGTQDARLAVLVDGLPDH